MKSNQTDNVANSQFGCYSKGTKPQSPLIYTDFLKDRLFQVTMLHIRISGWTPM